MTTSYLNDSTSPRNNIRRERKVIVYLGDNNIRINHKTGLDFSSNDYLGMRHHSAIRDLLKNISISHCSGASSLVSGYSVLHQELEQCFQEWLGFEHALLFNTGYAANVGMIPALSNRHSAIIADKYCHASMIDGIQLSKAKLQRFRHQTYDHAKTLVDKYQPDLLISESVFSMQGAATDINTLSNIKNQALLMIDDAHGFGVIGEKGRGASDTKNHGIDILVIPFGKALHNQGAIVLGSKALIDHALQKARSYCYSTALSELQCQMILTSLQLIQQESWRRDKLHDNRHFFQNQCTAANINHIPSDSAIHIIPVHDNSRCIRMQEKLWEKGFFTAAIRPPTVPDNQACLRISLNSLHTSDQIRSLVKTLAEAMHDG